MIKKILLGLKSLRASHEDAKLNRKLAGTDRFGNQYYQYYDDRGRESRRIMEPNPYASEPFDPLWTEWLRNRQKVPFTEKEMQSFYDVETMNKKNAYEYEIKDAKIMKEFRENYKKSQENEKNSMASGVSGDFNPGMWKPTKTKDSGDSKGKKN